MCDHDKEIYRGENDGCLIYRGKDYIVVNKPPGLDAEHGFPELLKKQYGFHDIYCVHRLDLAAGGLLVYALSDKAAGVFSRYIEEKQLKKSYLVVCEGVPVEAEGEWTDLLFKDSRKQKMFPVKRMRKGVKEAKLAYQVIVSKALSGDSDKGLQSDRDESELYLKKPENLMEKPTCADKEEVKKLEEKKRGRKTNSAVPGRAFHRTVSSDPRAIRIQEASACRRWEIWKPAEGGRAWTFLQRTVIPGTGYWHNAYLYGTT